MQKRMRKSHDGMVPHGLVIVKREGIRQLTVLAEVLLRIAALHVIKSTRVTAVVPGIDAALLIDFHAK